MTDSDAPGLTNSEVRYPRRYPRPSASKTETTTKKRTRSPHPGVVLLNPNRDGEHKAWRARYVDASGKQRKVTLEAKDAKTATTRKEWAMLLSETLQRGRSDAKAGVLRTVESVPLPKAVERFFEANPRLSPATQRSYRTAIATLVRGRERLTTVQLTRAVLSTWRTERVKARKLGARPSGERGGKRALSRLRSPFSVNKEVRSVGVFLHYWLANDLIRLTHQDIKAALKRERGDRELKSFLSQDQIRELLNACTRHDAAVFELTRDGSRTTPKYKPIAPFVRFLLLTGVRISEALAINWADVIDDRIHVRAKITKTKDGRTVDLSVAPSALPVRGTGRVFDLTTHEVHAARKRLADEFDAPEWSPHALRRTCSTFFTNAFDPWRAAKSIGHSVVVAERHYAGLVRVPAGCATLEQAMQLDDL